MVGAVQHIFSSPQAELTGTVTIFNSAAQTITMQASSLVGASEWNNTHQATVTLSGNTLNASTVSGSNIVLSATGPVSLSGTSNSIVITAAAAATPATISAWGVPQINALIPDQSTSVTFQPTGSSIYFGLFTLPFALTMSIVQVPMLITQTTTTASSTATITWANALYSLTGATYSLITSSTVQLQVSSTAGSSSFTITGQGAGNSTSYTITASTLMGLKLWQAPLATTLASGIPLMWAFSMATAGARLVAAPAVIQAADMAPLGRLGTSYGSGTFSQATLFNRLLGGQFNETSAGAFPASVSTSVLSANANLAVFVASMLA